MDLYTRSPKAYDNLRQVLKMPSPQHLIRYKNFIEQRPGIQHENLHWMMLEAKRINVSREGMCGFLVFDEMSVQVSQHLLVQLKTIGIIGNTMSCLLIVP